MLWSVFTDKSVIIPLPAVTRPEAVTVVALKSPADNVAIPSVKETPEIAPLADISPLNTTTLFGEDPGLILILLVAFNVKLLLTESITIGCPKLVNLLLLTIPEALISIPDIWSLADISPSTTSKLVTDKS